MFLGHTPNLLVAFSEFIGFFLENSPGFSCYFMSLFPQLFFCFAERVRFSP